MRLPDKPSALLKVAMQDLELCEADPTYQIDMGEWFTTNGKCSVCLAGSVMAQSLGLGEKVKEVREAKKQLLNTVKGTVFEDQFDFDAELSFEPEDVGEWNKLTALNAFRQGDVAGGLVTLDYAINPAFLDEYKNPVDIFAGDSWLENLGEMSRSNRKEWKFHMYDMIGVLEAEGL